MLYKLCHVIFYFIFKLSFLIILKITNDNKSIFISKWNETKWCDIYMYSIRTDYFSDEYNLNHSLHVSKLTGWFYFPISNVLSYFGVMEKLKTHSWKPFVSGMPGFGQADWFVTLVKVLRFTMNTIVIHVRFIIIGSIKYFKYCIWSLFNKKGREWRQNIGLINE